MTVLIRTYIGETSSAVISAMPPEKRGKSTLKYTAFFVTFSACGLSVLSGPGEFHLTKLLITELRVVE